MPRPAVCSPATTTVPSGAPASARSRAASFDDAHVSSRWMKNFIAYSFYQNPERKPPMQSSVGFPEVEARAVSLACRAQAAHGSPNAHCAGLPVRGRSRSSGNPDAPPVTRAPSAVHPPRAIWTHRIELVFVSVSRPRDSLVLKHFPGRKAASLGARDAELGFPHVKGRAFGSPLARGLYPRASTAEVDPRQSPGPRPPSLEPPPPGPGFLFCVRFI